MLRLRRLRRPHRLATLAGLPILWLVLCAAEKTPLEIRADRLDFDRKAGVARFEGSVEAHQADLSLRCQRLTATYDTAGELRTLVVEGGLSLTAEGLTARAERADFDQRTGEMTLTGQPELIRGADRLSGERIRFWPETGRIVIEKARGSVLLPRLRPPVLGPQPATATPPRGP